MKGDHLQSVGDDKPAFGTNMDVLIQTERISKIFIDTIHRIELVVN